MARLQAAPWAHPALINVIVQDGTADLWSVVDSQAEKKAVRVAAEITPGVRVRKRGRVVCAGIHMSNIRAFPTVYLLEVRQVLSVANLTRSDGIEFFNIAPQAGIVIENCCYPLARANDALSDLRTGQLQGAAVLVPRRRTI